MSLIWEIGLFKKTSKATAICLDCQVNEKPKYEYKLPKGTVKTLHTHLYALHDNSEFTEKLAALESKLKLKEMNQRQMAMTDFQSSSGGPIFDSSLSSIDKKIVNFLAKKNISFGAVDDPTFHALLSNQKVKSEWFYRKTALPIVYHCVKSKINKELSECDFISLTSDCWSGSTCNLLCLTSHSISNWKAFSRVLAITEFSESHTGKNIALKIEELLKNWNIPKNRIQAIVSDSAANMKRAFVERDENDKLILTMPNCPCSAHLLNLVVQEALKKDDTISYLLSKSRQIVGRFKHSNTAFSELRRVQKLIDAPAHSLLQMVSVRWNSALTMCERLIEQRAPITQYAVEHNEFDLLLKNNEWEQLVELAES